MRLVLSTEQRYLSLEKVERHFSVDSMESFMAAFVPRAKVLQGDMSNYTDIHPVIQVNEVLISQP